MIRRKVPFDVKVLTTSIGCLAYSFAIGTFGLTYHQWLDSSGFIGVLIVVSSALTSIYGMFGTFLAGCSVASRHNRKFRRFWEGGN